MEEFYKPSAQNAHQKKNSRIPKESRELERVGEIDEGEASNDQIPPGGISQVQ